MHHLDRIHTTHLHCRHYHPFNVSLVSPFVNWTFKWSENINNKSLVESFFTMSDSEMSAWWWSSSSISSCLWVSLFTLPINTTYLIIFLISLGFFSIRSLHYYFFIWSNLNLLWVSVLVFLFFLCFLWVCCVVASASLLLSSSGVLHLQLLLGFGNGFKFFWFFWPHILPVTFEGSFPCCFVVLTLPFPISRRLELTLWWNSTVNHMSVLMFITRVCTCMTCADILIDVVYQVETDCKSNIRPVQTGFWQSR